MDGNGLGSFEFETNDSVIGRALRLVWRLNDHIARLDAGVAYAVDDLAVVLRTLVSPGQGNDVLHLLASRIGGKTPKVQISRVLSESVVFGVGAVPTLGRGIAAHGARRVSVNEWMNTRVLTVTSASGRKSYTWAAFLAAYANKWGGAHLDPKLPDQLMQMNAVATAGLDLSSYLIRTAAVEVWRIANSVYANQVHFSADAKTQDELRGRVRVAAPHAEQKDPADISLKGALQWFYYNHDKADFLLYAHRDAPYTHARFLLGTMPYSMTFKPSDVEAAPPESVPVQSPQPYEPPSTVSTLNEVAVSGRILAFPYLR